MTSRRVVRPCVFPIDINNAVSKGIAMRSSLETRLGHERTRLANHQLYFELSDFENTRVLMQHHVFAVWDFFSLLKRLQREVTCVETPWRSKQLASHARFITEIVLAEECDEAIGGGYISHFDLYLSAMDEVGADRTAIDVFLARLNSGANVFAALESPEIPDFVREFVTGTLSVALRGEPHEVAASFCHGRENLLPDVFAGVRDGLGTTLDESPIFKHYLLRHIALDHDEHGPLALKLLDELCEDDPKKLTEADETGIRAIQARGQLWDGVLNEIRT